MFAFVEPQVSRFDEGKKTCSEEQTKCTSQITWTEQNTIVNMQVLTTLLDGFLSELETIMVANDYHDLSSSQGQPRMWIGRTGVYQKLTLQGCRFTFVKTTGHLVYSSQIVIVFTKLLKTINIFTFFRNCSEPCRLLKCCTRKPAFRLVVFEIACGIFTRTDVRPRSFFLTEHL